MKKKKKYHTGKTSELCDRKIVETEIKCIPPIIHIHGLIQALL